jgi:hypothetical protein
MNKMVKLAMLLVALTATFSYSIDTRFGIRVGYFITSMDGDFPKKQGESIDNGYGFSGGLIIMEENKSFDGEINFSQRKIWVPGLLESKQQDESAESVVVAYKFRLLGRETPFYLLLGPQIDIPITELDEYQDAMESEEKGSALSGVRFYVNLASGLGYIIADKIGIDARCVIGFSGGNIKKGRSFNQYGAGISYLF